MTPSKIEKLLLGGALGRLGCQLDGKVYVLPLNYGYDGKYIFAHSKEGLKIDIMRRNPEVCFEVDSWEEGGSWKSVLVWGTFEEIKSVKSQRLAMKIFSDQMARVIPDSRAMPSHGFVKGSNKEADPFKSVVFKIIIREKTGRFEDRP